jgi:hypothetical protein
MAPHIEQLIPADGWYAVFASPTTRAREHAGPSVTRPTAMARAGGPAPEFLPLVAWALVVDDSTSESHRVVGIIVHENQQPEMVFSDDPSFLGYAGPNDPTVDRVGVAPDWRALAKQAITELKQAQ